MNRPFIIYTHIEKCAGMTLNFLLGNNFPLLVYPLPVSQTNEMGTVYHYLYLKKLIKLLPLTQGISGHNVRPFIEYEKVIKRELFFFTFFREPIKRYLSHLNYQRIVMNINWNVDDFIDFNEMHNFQTVKIAGKSDIDEAKKIVEHRLNFFGLTEYFDQSIFLLNRFSGLNLNLFYKKRNVISSAKVNNKSLIKWEDLTKTQQKKILEVNTMDIELYSYCLSLFKRRYFNITHEELPENFYIDNSEVKKTNFKFYYSIAQKKFYRKVVEPIFFKEYISNK